MVESHLALPSVKVRYEMLLVLAEKSRPELSQAKYCEVHANHLLARDWGYSFSDFSYICSKKEEKLG